MSQEPLKYLRERSLMLQRARSFFADRGVMEVDCCSLVQRAPIDSNIDVISASVTDSEKGFLHTSPEYAMKRLLSKGSGDIYFLGHVFRKGEIGRIHNPEFTMAEWYRLSFSFDEMISETCEFLFMFLGPLPIRKIGYREAFSQYLGIDYKKDDLAPYIPTYAQDWSRETALHYLLSHKIEPHFGRGELTVLTEYPPSQAALASTFEKNGERVAERFEIYFEQVELANGYHELADASELRKRFEEENRIRKSLNKETYLLDEAFLSSLNNNFPECCGVSVGFDRALMLQQKASALCDVLPFSWNELLTS